MPRTWNTHPNHRQRPYQMLTVTQGIADLYLKCRAHRTHRADLDWREGKLLRKLERMNVVEVNEAGWIEVLVPCWDPIVNSLVSVPRHEN